MANAAAQATTFARRRRIDMYLSSVPPGPADDAPKGDKFRPKQASRAHFRAENKDPMLTAGLDPALPP